MRQYMRLVILFLHKARIGLSRHAGCRCRDVSRLTVSDTLDANESPELLSMYTAFQLLSQRPDKSYSFVDATSFVVMRSKEIHTALTLDHHFTEEGFRVVPVSPPMVHARPEPTFP